MPESSSPRRAGALLHVTSLPSGKIDDDCLRWLDFMADAGLSVWQVLPLVIPDLNRSPYQSRSAFATDPALLPDDDAPADADAVDAYRADHAAWLDDFALFEVLKHRFEGRAWVDWPSAYRDREPRALASLGAQARDDIRAVIEQQYRLDRAWRRVRQHAEERGISLFGDIPIFIAHDSADTWARPANFLLDETGQPTHVAGVPPDYFAAEGQRWGNPHYDWQRMQRNGFDWWIERMRHQFELFDLVRIDHFRGLVAVWMIDAACETAIDGHWQDTPGDALLASLRARFPSLPIVAEDLGVITDEVRALRGKYQLPGMSVLQFAFDEFADNPHKPANFATNNIAYTGTHDNDTAVGWFDGLAAHERDFVFHVLGTEPRDDIAWLMIENIMQSRAQIAIAPLQDYLGLGSDARMNTPGLAEGNWQWRFDWDMLTRELAGKIRTTVEISERLHVA